PDDLRLTSPLLHQLSQRPEARPRYPRVEGSLGGRKPPSVRQVGTALARSSRPGNRGDRPAYGAALRPRAVAGLLRRTGAAGASVPTRSPHRGAIADAGRNP